MLLSDNDIHKVIKQGDLVVDPFIINHVQPASIDMRLGCHFKRQRTDDGTPIDPSVAQEDRWMAEEYAVAGAPVLIGPNEFFLASTIERVEFWPLFAGRLDGKSSVARCSGSWCT